MRHIVWSKRLTTIYYHYIPIRKNWCGKIGTGCTRLGAVQGYGVTASS